MCKSFVDCESKTVQFKNFKNLVNSLWYTELHDKNWLLDFWIWTYSVLSYFMHAEAGIFNLFLIFKNKFCVIIKLCSSRSQPRQLYCGILQLSAEFREAKLHSNIILQYKITHNVSLVLKYPEKSKTKPFACFWKRMFDHTQFWLFWPNPKFWLYLNL